MENNKFKIALFMLPPLTQGGGAEAYFIELARSLSEKGYQTDIITMDEKFFRKFARLLHIFVLGNFFGKIDTAGRESEESVRARLGKAGWVKASFKNLGNILGGYDTIYSKNEVADIVLLKLKSYKKLPPVVVGVHTPLFYPETRSFISKLHNFLYSSIFYKWLLRGTAGVHVSNRFANDFVEKRLNVKSRLVYYPFSVKAIADLTKENPSGLNFDDNKRNIVFVGRLGEQKGANVLLYIIQEIGREKSLAEKMQLNIFGSGDKECEKKLCQLAEKFSFVRYFGHVENKYIPGILAKQNLMIAPSKWETLPYSILEAQAMGLPVVAFDIPGPNDIICHKRTGYLAKGEDDFMNAVKNFAEDKMSFDENKIIRNIEEKFHPDNIHQQMINMFSEYL